LAERLCVLAAAALFSAWHWRQLERPQAGIAEMAALCALAAAPAILAALGRRHEAIVAAVVSVPVAVWVGFRYLPWQTGHHVYPVRIVQGLRDGARSWFDTATPFDPGRFPTTEGLVAVCFFLLFALLAWLVLDGRHGLAGVATAFALFAIPSTSLGLGAAGFRAALFLLLAVAILAVCQRSAPSGGGAMGQLAALAAATVVAGLVVGSAPGVAKGAFFDWRHWNPLSGGPAPVSVNFVWDQTYGPLIWPKKQTTVFEVKTTGQHYWKAGVLNDFTGTRWEAGPTQVAGATQQTTIRVPTAQLPSNATGPHKPEDIQQFEIKIDALADDHLLSTGQPILWDSSTPMSGQIYADSSVTLSSDPARGATYSAEAYTPSPTPKQLAAAGSDFPQSVLQTLQVGATETRIPLWRPGASPKVRVALDRRLIEASNQVWKRSGADGPNTSEYGAVAAVESYFHRKQFVYDLRPPAPKPGVPWLADFMLHSHRGYCQMFSGSMALVLRLHGIPARVAVGFTEGKATAFNHYVITDRDAHSWVEAYFPHWGWIPFEPTQGKTLPEETSTTNKLWATKVGDREQGIRIGIPTALAKLRLLSGHHPITKQNGNLHHGGGTGGGVRPIPVQHHHTGFFLWAVSATAILIAALSLVKLVAVRWRWLRRGPRGQASAAYHELATYIGDQGVSLGANATFEDLARVLDHTWAVDATALAAAGSAARYAPPALAAAAGHEIRPALRRVRHELRDAIDLRDRLTGALRLRSMLAQTTHLD
jgi:transglutaminase-like putative cysteine protease